MTSLRLLAARLALPAALTVASIGGFGWKWN